VDGNSSKNKILKGKGNKNQEHEEVLISEKNASPIN
jgi:hypothetical protein